MIRLRVVAFVLVTLTASGEKLPEEMVLIPAGEFTMGRTELTPDDKTTMRPHIFLDDRPVRKVSLDAYYLDTHEITNQKYAEFLTKNPGQSAPYHWVGGKFPEGSGTFPVFNVNWESANSYCAWAGKRLPTEAEWERAARSGQDGLDYPWGNKISSQNARYDVRTGPGPVGGFPPNSFGLYDMISNMAEWCSDWFNRTYYEAGENRNPKGPENGLYKVIRGGSWADGPRRITVFFRNWVHPNQRTPNIGFRCAKSSVAE